MSKTEIVVAGLKYGGIVLIAVAIAIAFASVLLSQQGVIWKYWSRYVAYLDRLLRSMFLWTPARNIVYAQGALALLVVGVHVAIDLPFWYAFIGLILVAPVIYIQRLRRERIDAIERQLDGFMQAFANALKTTPSIGQGLASIQPLLQNPLKNEVELALKQMKVGSSIDHALLDMGARVGSRQLDAALSSILIGRQVGGNLPKVLETTAASLREMARLEGVVRTKTAEGKMQLWVLALFPAFIVLALNTVSAGYFDPLTKSFVGYLLVTVAALFWIGSLVLARKVLSVDL